MFAIETVKLKTEKTNNAGEKHSKRREGEGGEGEEYRQQQTSNDFDISSLCRARNERKIEDEKEGGQNGDWAPTESKIEGTGRTGGSKKCVREGEREDLRLETASSYIAMSFMVKFHFL